MDLTLRKYLKLHFFNTGADKITVFIEGGVLTVL